jgi:hypothetical protein
MPERQDGEPRTCIFCGAKGKLSKQHLWPAWLQDVFEFPKPTSPHGRFLREAGSELQCDVWEMEPFEQRVTAPCRRCNNGWMSDIEKRTKGLLIPLIGGQTRRWLNPAAQEAIAVWGIQTAMMAQFVYPKRRAIRDSDYAWLYRHRSAPPDYRVWIGMRLQEGGDWPAFYRHSALTLAPPGWDLEEMDNTNAHRSTIGVGHLVIHVVGHYVEDAPVFDIERAYQSAFARIWPATEGVEWPPRAVLGMDTIRQLTPASNEMSAEMDSQRLLAMHGHRTYL